MASTWEIIEGGGLHVARLGEILEDFRDQFRSFLLRQGPGEVGSLLEPGPLEGPDVRIHERMVRILDEQPPHHVEPGGERGPSQGQFVEQPQVRRGGIPFLVGILERLDQAVVDQAGRLDAEDLGHRGQDLALGDLQLRAPLEQVRLALGDRDGIRVLAAQREGVAFSKSSIRSVAQLAILLELQRQFRLGRRVLVLQHLAEDRQERE
jgi:hypothetical protein